jgi:tetraacyldisaccharide 4'-kinase
MRDPAFWWTERSVAAALLAPAAACYGAIAARRMARPGLSSPVPVVCVGNFTVGGAGKTPTAIALARLLLQSGRRPFFLSRGYGGRAAGPVRINLVEADQGRDDLRSPSRDPHEGKGGEGAWTAAEVGDEPLLLAAVAPVVVARDRPAGVMAAVAGGADTIIMDDGLQNPSVTKDLALVVVDGRRGIGNGRIFPAGPLRAPLEAQLDHVDAVLVVGAAGPAAGRLAADRAIAAACRRGVRMLHGELQPAPEAVATLAGRRVLAFAGIGDPGKFFATLEAHGIPAAVRKPFPDHHPYTADEMAGLVACADRNGLTLVTTEKDMARLHGVPGAAELVKRAAVLPVMLKFSDEAGVAAMLRDVRRGGAAASHQGPSGQATREGNSRCSTARGLA